jgi:putative membrane protein
LRGDRQNHGDSMKITAPTADAAGGSRRHRNVMDSGLIPSGPPRTLAGESSCPGLKEGVMFGSGWCGNMGVGGWLLMAVIWGGFLAVIVWAVLRLLPRGTSRPAGPGDGDNAASVLDRRLAAGDIDEDTYRRLRRELTRTG